jgi:hypothetical protein
LLKDSGPAIGPFYYKITDDQHVHVAVKQTFHRVIGTADDGVFVGVKAGVDQGQVSGLLTKPGNDIIIILIVRSIDDLGPCCIVYVYDRR